MKIKLLVSDIDGVWTDASFYYSKEGDILRKFNTRDSYGVKLCELLQIPILIVSTEDSAIVKKRMEKLKLKYVKLGIRNKLRSISHFCDQRRIKLSEVAYIGDDMNDYHLLKEVGFFSCPADAYSKIREKADLVLSAKGGEGAFREFVEYLLQQEGKFEEAYNLYVDECLEK